MTREYLHFEISNARGEWAEHDFAFIRYLINSSLPKINRLLSNVEYKLEILKVITNECNSHSVQFEYIDDESNSKFRFTMPAATYTMLQLKYSNI